MPKTLRAWMEELFLQTRQDKLEKLYLEKHQGPTAQS
jgi:hypothetical protein